MQNHQISKCIILFMRAPELGKVKTRLSKDVGSEIVLNLYKCFVRDILHTAQKTKVDIKIFLHPPESETLVSQWLGDQYTLYPQKGEDLGQRMADAFARTFSSGYHQAILIGTDCPEMTPGILQQAFQGIKDNGSVIGPSIDGGYYLVGFSADAFTDKLFHNMVWGTDQVYHHTLNRCSQQAITPFILQQLNDIDTVEDLRLFRKHAPKSKYNTQTFQYLVANEILKDA